MAVCPSVGIYRSGLHWTDSRQIWLWGLYGNLSSNWKFVWNGSNMLAIATTTAQSRDCGQDQVFCVCCVVLLIVQFAHISIVMILKDVCAACHTHTHTHTHPTCKYICTHSCMTEVFQCRLLLQTQHTYVACHKWHDFRKNYSTWNVCLDSVSKFCPKHCCHILMKLEICRQIFKEYSNTRLHEN